MLLAPPSLKKSQQLCVRVGDKAHVCVSCYNAVPLASSAGGADVCRVLLHMAPVAGAFGA